MLSRLAPRSTTRMLVGTALALKGVAWVGAPSGVRLALATAGLLTVADRYTAQVLAASSLVIGLVLVSGADYANHLYLLGLMSAFGALANLRHPTTREVGRFLMLSQVSITYFWAAVWKVNPVFLTGSVLAVEWHRNWLLGSFLPGGAFLVACALITVVGELALAAGLWTDRFRRPVVALGLILHAGMILTIGEDWVTTMELVVFALLCASSFPLFLERVPRLEAQPAGV